MEHSKAFAFGVQWHPEWQVLSNPAYLRIFQPLATPAGNGPHNGAEPPAAATTQTIHHALPRGERACARPSSSVSNTRQDHNNK